MINDSIDVIATDHAPHTLEEKAKQLFSRAPSGGPVWYSTACLPCSTSTTREKIGPGKKSWKRPRMPWATLFEIDKRGYLREGYHADVVTGRPEQALGR